jgi:peptidoglycan biosynthesis protein MviN/MurJ (putative lipid II flippase)
MLLRPYFYAAQRTTVLLKITTFTCLMDVAIVLILYKYYGFLSIAITISLTSYIAGLILFLAQMQGKFIKINMKLIQYFLQYICFCVILFLILYFISKSLIIFSASHLISLMVLGFIYILSCIIMVIIFDRHLLQVTIKRIGSMIKGI